MLFNSFEFVLFFLPVVAFGFFAIGGRGHHRIAIAWLVGASLFFYGWWNPAYLGLIVGSMLFNYSVGLVVGSRSEAGVMRRLLLVFGIAANLLVLGYFKYAGFFLENMNAVFDSGFDISSVFLPLAISFFTFQQIAYLVDAFRGETREYNFLHYCLFVTFFPQLIAGPIVHHREMMPQFVSASVYRLQWDNIGVGLTIFILGLFKKVVLADGVSSYATPVFHAADSGEAVTFFEAWGGALAYTLQLYFDFSGYADMAIGAARVFGIRLPVNFNSPYQSTSIIEFWRRWHITLSRFLKDYLYIPLGGNRYGTLMKYRNLLITMLLGGLWHGAGWNFIIWGGLHGLYLVVNHSWRRVVSGPYKHPSIAKVLSWGLTFMAVVVAWVFFRAETLDGALQMLAGMAGLSGVVVSPKLEMLQVVPGIRFDADFMGSFGSTKGWGWILVLGAVALCMPNVLGLLKDYRPVIDCDLLESSRLRWRPTLGWAVAVGALAFVALFSLTQVSEFLYFRF